MTFYEYGKDQLFQRGMFESQATEVMDRVVIESNENPESINSTMKDRWGDDIADYPPLTLNLVYLGIEPIALAYIEETCPQAWFKPMFDKNHPLWKEYEASIQKEA